MINRLARRDTVDLRLLSHNSTRELVSLLPVLVLALAECPATFRVDLGDTCAQVTLQCKPAFVREFGIDSRPENFELPVSVFDEHCRLADFRSTFSAAHEELETHTVRRARASEVNDSLRVPRLQLPNPRRCHLPDISHVAVSRSADVEKRILHHEPAVNVEPCRIARSQQQAMLPFWQIDHANGLHDVRRATVNVDASRVVLVRNLHERQARLRVFLGSSRGVEVPRLLVRNAFKHSNEHSVLRQIRVNDFRFWWQGFESSPHAFRRQRRPIDRHLVDPTFKCAGRIATH